MKSKYGVRIFAASLILMFTLLACGGGREQSADVEFAPKLTRRKRNQRRRRRRNRQKT